MKIKNYLLLTAAILTTISSVKAGKFYAGAGVTTINSSSTIVDSGTDHVHSGTLTISDNSAAVSGRVFGGYEKHINNFFVAGEVIAAPQDIKGKNGPVDMVTQAGVTIQTNFYTKYSRNYTFGAKAKVGSGITENLSVFASLGVINSQFKMTYATTGVNNSYKKNVYGWEPGVGLSYKLSPNVRLGLEYLYQQYKRFNTKDLDPTVNSVKFNPRFKFNSFFASISYVI